MVLGCDCINLCYHAYTGRTRNTWIRMLCPLSVHTGMSAPCNFVGGTHSFGELRGPWLPVAHPGLSFVGPSSCQLRGAGPTGPGTWSTAATLWSL